MSTAALSAAPVPDRELHRIDLPTFRRLADAGLLGPEGAVGLLDGLLVKPVTKRAPHSLAVLHALHVLGPLVPEGWHLRPEQVIALTGGPLGDSLPEPDLAIVRGTLDDYPETEPSAEDAALVIEIVSTNEAAVPDVIARYAAGQVPRLWVAHLNDRRVDVFEGPSGPTDRPHYHRISAYTEDAPIPWPLPGIDSIPAAVLLRQGPRR